MEQNRRFTIFAFPQGFKNNLLKLNILFLPRNQNPLNPAIQDHPIIPDSPSFANSNLSFNANIITGLNEFPMNVKVTNSIPLNIVNPAPADKNALFTTLANSFQITNLGQINNNLNINTISSQSAPAPKPKTEIANSINKYLPLTYRKSFNFVAPKVKNAKIDDSYHCAIRDAGKQPGFKISGEEISWGQVYAYALRQQQLAIELG